MDRHARAGKMEADMLVGQLERKLPLGALATGMALLYLADSRGCVNTRRCSGTLFQIDR